MNYQFILIGAIVTITGILMRSIKPNFFIGIRLPSTLNNEEVWKKTHAFASKLFIVSGILIIIFSQFLQQQAVTILAPALVGTAIIISVAYSMHLNKRT